MFILHTFFSLTSSSHLTLHFNFLPHSLPPATTFSPRLCLPHASTSLMPLPLLLLSPFYLPSFPFSFSLFPFLPLSTPFPLYPPFSHLPILPLISPHPFPLSHSTPLSLPTILYPPSPLPTQFPLSPLPFPSSYSPLLSTFPLPSPHPHFPSFSLLPLSLSFSLVFSLALQPEHSCFRLQTLEYLWSIPVEVLRGENTENTA